MRPPVAILGLWHETNTAGPHPTTLEDFARFELAEGDEVGQLNAGTGSVIGGFLESKELQLRPVFSAGAWPSGPVTAAASSELLDRALDRLSQAGRVDGVLVNLHGAMVAEDDPDPELRLLRETRRLVGDAPIAAVLDLHANVSAELPALCDVLISYDTFPHVDMRERGREAATLLTRMLESGQRFATSIAKVPVLACPLAQGTSSEPMRGLQVRAGDRARLAGLERVSVVGGFAYSDVARAGMSILAVHKGGCAEAVDNVLSETAADILDHAEEFNLQREGTEDAVRRALASSKRPLVLVDVADNVGGGSAGDGTEILRELLAQGAEGAVVLLADEEAVQVAIAAGAGAAFRALVGGKADHRHGEPLLLAGEVVRISDGRYRTAGTWMTGRSFEMGTTAVVSSRGNTIVLTERRVPPFHLEQITSLGVDPEAANFIVAKGALAWRAAYGELAKEVIEVATPGVCPVDVAAFPRTTKPMRYP